MYNIILCSILVITDHDNSIVLGERTGVVELSAIGLEYLAQGKNVETNSCVHIMVKFVSDLQCKT